MALNDNGFGNLVPISEDDPKYKEAADLFEQEPAAPKAAGLSPEGMATDTAPIYSQEDKKVGPLERIRLESEKRTGVETTIPRALGRLGASVLFGGDERKVEQKNALVDLAKGSWQTEDWAKAAPTAPGTPGGMVLPAHTPKKRVNFRTATPEEIEGMVKYAGLDPVEIGKLFDARVAWEKENGESRDPREVLADIVTGEAESNLRRRVHVSSRAAETLPEGGKNKKGFGYSFLGGGLMNTPYMGTYVLSSAVGLGPTLPLLSSYDRRYEAGRETGLGFGEGGELVETKAGLDPEQAAEKAVIGAAAETAIEMVGGKIVSGAGKLAGKFILAPLARKVAPKTVAAIEKMGQDALRNNPSLRKFAQSWKAASEITKVQEYPSEIAEEYAQNLTDAIFQLTPDAPEGNLGQRFAAANEKFGGDLGDILLTLAFAQAIPGAVAGVQTAKAAGVERAQERGAAAWLKVAGVSDEQAKQILADGDARAAVEYVTSDEKRRQEIAKRVSDRSAAIADNLLKTNEWMEDGGGKNAVSRFVPPTPADLAPGEDGVARYENSGVGIEYDAPNNRIVVTDTRTGRQAFVFGGQVPSESLEQAFAIADAFDREAQGRDAVNAKKRELLSKAIEARGVDGTYVFVDSPEQLATQVSEKARAALAQKIAEGAIPQAFVDTDEQGNTKTFFILDNIRMGKGVGALGQSVNNIVEVATHEPVHVAQFSPKAAKTFNAIFDKADDALRMDVIRYGIAKELGAGAVESEIASLAPSAEDDVRAADNKLNTLRKWFAEGTAYLTEGNLTDTTTGTQKLARRVRDFFKAGVAGVGDIRVLTERGLAQARGPVRIIDTRMQETEPVAAEKPAEQAPTPQPAEEATPAPAAEAVTETAAPTEEEAMPEPPEGAEPPPVEDRAATSTEQATADTERTVAKLSGTERKTVSGETFYHGGLPKGATLDSVDLDRSGTQQNKKGRSYGGFYLTDASSKAWSEKYASGRGGVLHALRFKPGSRVFTTRANIDRLSADQRAVLKAAGYAAIEGKDTLGRNQVVLLDKTAVESFAEEPATSAVAPATVEEETAAPAVQATAEAVQPEAPSNVVGQPETIPPAIAPEKAVAPVSAPVQPEKGTQAAEEQVFPLPEIRYSQEEAKAGLADWQLKELAEYEDLAYKSNAVQGREKGYRPYKLTEKQKTRLAELRNKYRFVYREGTTPEAKAALDALREKALAEAKSGPAKKETRPQAVARVKKAFAAGEPVPAADVDRLGVKIPDTYGREGDNYVKLAGIPAQEQKPAETPAKAEKAPEREQKKAVGALPEQEERPLLRQWRKIKQQLEGGPIVLMKVGDFYEAFIDDAKKVADVLKIPLTQRNGTPMAGFPYHALNKSVEKLVKSGHKLAIVEESKGVGNILDKDFTKPTTQKEASDAEAVRGDEGQVREGKPRQGDAAEAGVRQGAVEGGGDLQRQAPEAPRGEQGAVKAPELMTPEEASIRFSPWNKVNVPEVSSPSPHSRVKLTYLTLGGPKTVNATTFWLPSYSGPALAVSERAAPKGMREKLYIVHFADTGDVVESTSGTVDKNTALKTAVRRLRAWQEKTGKPVTMAPHASAVLTASRLKKPVNASAVDAYSIKLPPGYVREGDLYVFKSEPPTPPDDGGKKPVPPAREPEKQVGKPATPSSDVSGREVSAIPKGARVSTAYGDSGVSYRGEFVKDNGDGTATLRAFGEKPKTGLFRRYGTDAKGVQIAKDVTVPLASVKETEPAGDTAKLTPAQRAAVRRAAKAQESAMEAEIAAGESAGADTAGRMASAEERRERARTDNETMFRVTPAEDAEYMAAVEAGDTDKAQSMVDEAAKRAGYNVGPVWHGSPPERGDFNVFAIGSHGTYFTPARYIAERYASNRAVPRRFFVKMKNPEFIPTQKESVASFLGASARLRKRILDAKKSGELWLSDAEWRVKNDALKRGYDGFVLEDYFDYGKVEAVPQYIVFDPSQIKSADPVTRDDAGNVIPLSQRFNEATPDIRFRVDNEQFQQTEGAGNEQRNVAERFALPAITLPDSIQREMQGGHRQKLLEDLRGVHRQYQKDLADDGETPDIRFRVDQTETPEFKRWFGDSKVVDADGKPLVVYHGSAQNFSTFSREKLGENTGAKSAKKAFFFVNNPDVSSGYALSAINQGEAGVESAGSLWLEKSSEVKKSYNEMIQYERDNGVNAYNEQTWTDDYRRIRDTWLSNSRQEKVALKKYDALRKPTVGTGEIFHGMGVVSKIKGGFSVGANVMPVYLSMKNPLVHDFQNKSYRDVKFSQLIDEAIEVGYDGVIFKNTDDAVTFAANHDVYAVFRPEQIKSATGNVGTFDPTNPDIRFRVSQPQDAEDLARAQAQFAALRALMDKPPEDFYKAKGEPDTPIVSPVVLDRKGLDEIAKATGTPLQTPAHVSQKSEVRDALADYSEDFVRSAMDRINREGRPIETNDTVAKIREFERRRLFDAETAAIEMDAAIRSGNVGRQLALLDEKEALVRDLDQAAQALALVGSERGRQLAFLKYGLDRNLSIIYRMQKIRKATGAPVTTEQYDKLVAQLAKERAEMKRLAEEHERVVAEVEQETRAKTAKEVEERMNAEVLAAYRKGAGEERSNFERLMSRAGAKKARMIDPAFEFSAFDPGTTSFRVDEGKEKPSDYPAALRELARSVFTKTREEGLGFASFAERMFEQGTAKGFSEETVDSYVYDFARRLNAPVLSKPAEKWKPATPKMDAGDPKKEATAEKRRRRAVKEAVRLAVAENMLADGYRIAQIAADKLRGENNDATEWGYLTPYDVMAIVTGYPAQPDIDTRDELTKRSSMVRRHMLAQLRMEELNSLQYPTKMASAADKPDVTLRQLARELRDRMNAHEFPAGEEDVRLMNAERALASRLRYAVEELQKAVDSGRPINEKAPRAVEETPEIADLRRTLKELRAAYEALPAVGEIREARDAERARRAANKRYHFWQKRAEDAKNGVFPDTFKGVTAESKDEAVAEYAKKAEAARKEYWAIKKASPQERIRVMSEKVAKAEERLADLEAKLALPAAPDLRKPKAPEQAPASPEEAALAATLAERRAAIERVKKAISARWRDENAEDIEAAREAERYQFLVAKAAMLEDKIRRGDFSKAPQRPRVWSARIAMEEAKVRAGLRAIEERATWEANAARGLGGKIDNARVYGREVYKFYKTMWDLSAVGVQSARLFGFDPLFGTKLIGQTAANAWTDMDAAKFQEAMHNDVDYARAYEAGLALDQNYEDIFGTGMGESAMRRIEDWGTGEDKGVFRRAVGGGARIGLASQRAFEMYSRMMRFHVFKSIVNDPAHANLSKDELRAIANMVNIMGGVGNTKFYYHDIASVMSRLMWSSRLFTAQWQTLTGGGGLLWNAGMARETSRAKLGRKWYQTAAPGALKLYSRSLAGTFALSQLFGAIGMLLGDRQPWEDEESMFWKAFDFMFGRRVIGSKSIDTFGGLTAYTALLKRAYKSAMGMPNVSMSGRDLPDDGWRAWSQAMANFARGRLRPDIAVGLSVVFGKDVTGEPFGPRGGGEGMVNLAKEGLFPITPAEMFDTVDDMWDTHGVVGVTAGLVPALASDLFGFSKSSVPRDPRYEINRHKAHLGQVRKAVENYRKEPGEKAMAAVEELRRTYAYDLGVSDSVAALERSARIAEKIAEDEKQPKERREKAAAHAKDALTKARDILRAGNR